MNKENYRITVLILTTCLGLFTCSNYKSDNAQANKVIADIAISTTQQTNSSTLDSLAMQKVELRQIYTQAISEFIKAAYKKDHTTFDTLYFGKHIYGQPDDFPDIELPQTIGNTQIKLIAPELGQKIQTERKSLVYVNMMGWVENNKAEFVLVVFSNGGEHQYDYFINFIAKTTTNIFDLDKVEFENYLHLKGQKPKRETIYKNGN